MFPAKAPGLATGRLLFLLSAHAKDPAAAKALLDYLPAPEANAAYKAQGMNPGDIT